MTSPTIRLVEEADLPAVRLLDAEAFGDDAITGRALRNFFTVGGSLTFVAETDEGLCGYIIGACKSDRSGAWSFGLAVTPSCHRRGIGTELRHHQIRAVQELGIPELWMMCKPTNAASIALHQRLGFQEQEIVENYLGLGEHRLLMKLDVTTYTGQRRRQ